MKESFSPLFSQIGPWNSVSMEWWQFHHFFVRNYSFLSVFSSQKKSVAATSQEETIPLFIWDAFPRLLSSRQTATWNYLASNFLHFFFPFFLTRRCKWKHFPVDTFVTCVFLLTRERNVVMNCEHAFSLISSQGTWYISSLSHVLLVLIKRQPPFSTHAHNCITFCILSFFSI